MAIKKQKKELALEQDEDEEGLDEDLSLTDDLEEDEEVLGEEKDLNW